MKTSKQVERHFKGIANHRRIDILLLVEKNDGIILERIAEELDCNIKTVSEHTRRLVHAGLLYKKYQGRSVAHTLSPYGKLAIKFINTLLSDILKNVGNKYDHKIRLRQNKIFR